MNFRLRSLIGAPGYAYDRYFADRGEFAQIPAKRMSMVEKHRGQQFVVFRNVNGLLAIYRIEPDRSLTEIEFWTDRETDRLYVDVDVQVLMVRSDSRWGSPRN